MWPVLVLSVALNVAAPLSHAKMIADAESSIAQAVNGARISQSLHGLTVAPDLRSRSRRHSAQMSARGLLFHTTSLTRSVPNWRILGENVGMASGPGDAFTYFMGSDSHRNLILDPAFRAVGVGVAERDGTLFITITFAAR